MDIVSALMNTVPQSPAETPGEIRPGARALSESDAVDVWIARWLRVRRKDLVQRYNCDPRRLYEIWEGTRFPAAKAKARAIFDERYPGVADRVDFGHHRRFSRAIDPNQLGFFD
jgi:hypothetical protein